MTNEFKSWMDVVSPKKELSIDTGGMIGMGTCSTVAASSALTISSSVNNWTLSPVKNGGIQINLEEKPNIWTRFWMRLFFGWKFEKLK